jgi:hypothetical protein
MLIKGDGVKDRVESYFRGKNRFIATLLIIHMKRA